VSVTSCKNVIAASDFNRTGSHYCSEQQVNADSDLSGVAVVMVLTSDPQLCYRSSSIKLACDDSSA
jgi:hypothetical protein